MPQALASSLVAAAEAATTATDDVPRAQRGAGGLHGSGTPTTGPRGTTTLWSQQPHLHLRLRLHPVQGGVVGVAC